MRKNKDFTHFFITVLPLFDKIKKENFIRR